MASHQHRPSMALIAAATHRFERPETLWAMDQWVELSLLRQWSRVFASKIGRGDRSLLSDNDFLLAGLRYTSEVFFVRLINDVPVRWSRELTVYDTEERAVAGMTDFDPDTNDCTIKLNPEHFNLRSPDGRPRPGILSVLLHEACHAFLLLYSCRPECAACSEASQFGLMDETGHGLAWQTLAFNVERSFNRFCSLPGPVDLNRRSAAKLEAEAGGFRPDNETIGKLFDGACPITDVVLRSRTLYKQVLTQINNLTNTARIRFALYRRSWSRLSAPSRRTFVAKATEYLPAYADYNDSQSTVRSSIAKICSRFPEKYWLDIDNAARWPSEFQEAVAKDGWLGIMMPSEYGGSELGLAEATVMTQTIAESGGGYTASSCVHMNIFGLAPVVKYGNEEQRKRFLTPLIEGKERACFAVTEPNTGLDTLKLQSLATRDGDHYSLKGSKIWTSTAQVAEKILILVRTTPLEEVKKPTEGLTLFYTDLDRSQVSVTEIKKMGRAAVDTNSLYFDGWRVPVQDRIGNEGDGFKMIMHGMNAERILLSGEAVGIGYAALRHASNYARERIVFGRPIGKNQAVAHPLAKAWCQLESTRLMIMQAAKMWDEGFATGEYANAVKYLAGENAFTACETAVCSMGGMGYAKECHVERFLREVIIPRLAPVSREMCLNYIAEKVMDQPRSY
ncbi:hypothetical protein LTS09_009512 [Friedmanniomyces endolithicus]|nr:hypothetical protein LTS09_009512 [Friedmanniomyces endolithicus]